jgi:hypothetical protein
MSWDFKYLSDRETTTSYQEHLANVLSLINQRIEKTPNLRSSTNIIEESFKEIWGLCGSSLSLGMKLDREKWSEQIRSTKNVYKLGGVDDSLICQIIRIYKEWLPVWGKCVVINCKPVILKIKGQPKISGFILGEWCNTLQFEGQCKVDSFHWKNEDNQREKVPIAKFHFISLRTGC